MTPQTAGMFSDFTWNKGASWQWLWGRDLSYITLQNHLIYVFTVHTVISYQIFLFCSVPVCLKRTESFNHPVIYKFEGQQKNQTFFYFTLFILRSFNVLLFAEESLRGPQILREMPSCWWGRGTRPQRGWWGWWWEGGWRLRQWRASGLTHPGDGVEKVPWKQLKMLTRLYRLARWSLWWMFEELQLTSAICNKTALN